VSGVFAQFLQQRVVNGSTKQPLLIRLRGFGLGSDGIEMVPKDLSRSIVFIRDGGVKESAVM